MSTKASEDDRELEGRSLAVAELPEYFAKIDRGRKRLIALGFVIVLLGFGGLGAWAALAPLQSAVVAQGIVKVSSERKTVQHLEGGVIKDILVKEGDEVDADELLIRLDDTTPKARVELLQSKLDRLRATLARLQAEQTGLAAIEFPEELLQRQDDSKVARLLASEREVFESRREALTGEKEVLLQRGRQYEEQIAGLKTQISSTRVQLGTIKEEKDAVEILYKKGVYEKPRYLELKRALARLEGQIGAHRSSIAQVEERIGEVKLRIIDLEKKRAEQINTQMQQVQSDLFDTEETLRAAKNTLERTDIRAPQAGTVVGLSVHTVGGVIRSGSDILDIVPEGDVLVVEARVRPEDIDIVHEGLEAEVLLTAFNRRTTPALPGSVTRVSADSFMDDAGTFYRIRVEIDPQHITDLDLYPGMPAEVYLLTGQQTALAYLLKPIEDSLRRGLLEE
jgi:HlyD family type I secretion membrane fusion protein